MNKKEIVSNLKIIDLYHEKFDFYQSRQEGEIELKTSFSVNFFVNKEIQNRIKVQFDTTIKDADGNYKLTLTTIGVFELDRKQLDDETVQTITQQNTVSIMFPYIRSQISLLTTQPGIQPIMIPPLNINALLNQE